MKNLIQRIIPTAIDFTKTYQKFRDEAIELNKLLGECQETDTRLIKKYGNSMDTDTMDSEDLNDLYLSRCAQTLIYYFLLEAHFSIRNGYLRMGDGFFRDLCNSYNSYNALLPELMKKGNPLFTLDEFEEQMGKFMAEYVQCNPHAKEHLMRGGNIE